MRAWLAIGALVLAGSCEKAPEPAKDFNHADYASHCVNGLRAAAETKTVSAEQSSLTFPWAITKVAGTDDLPILECSIRDGGKYRFVTVQMVCEDADRDECSRLVGVSDFRRD